MKCYFVCLKNGETIFNNGRIHGLTLFQVLHTTDIVNLANAYNHLSRKYFCEALLNVCREERENSRFIPKEDEYLLELKADKGLNTEQIAAILGRTPFAIQTRCSSLFGIKNKSKPVDGIFKGVIKTTESGETDISGRVWKRE